MDKFHQELFGVLTQARRSSKAAAMQQPEEMVLISTCEYNELTNHLIQKSKAASLSTIFNGTKRIPKREYIDLLMNASIKEE